MGRRRSFLAKAIAGYAAVVLLLAGGMTLAIRSLGLQASEQVAHLRALEDEITLAEHLRWTGEVLVSAGRGFLLSGDATLLARQQAAEADFARSIQVLRGSQLPRRGAALVEDVERAAASFTRHQAQLLAAKQDAVSSAELARRFELELLPLQRELGQALDRFVDHMEGHLKGAYERGSAARARTSLAMRGLLGFLVLSSLGASWYFATVLARSFRQEQDALDQAQQALAMRDEVMGIIAHDLRNPLNVITMQAALLRRTEEPGRARSQAASIENAAMRMDALIRSMLDVASYEAGQLTVAPIPCEVAGLLRDTIDLFESLAAAKKLQLQRRGEAEPGLCVRADRERVLQVFSNLIGNAIKFTPPGGQVELSVERHGEVVRFGVSDSGPGITREHLPHLFDRFWKHETEGKRGTGLGLFISKVVIDGHGGRIWAESAPGHGATFLFTLPVVPAAGATGAQM